MINEKKLAELRKASPWLTVDFKDRWPEVADTLDAALKVVRAAMQIEDVVEIPERLGLHSQLVIGKAIQEFRDSLAPFRADRGVERK